MKKYIYSQLALVLSLMIMLSCEGPQGIPGRDGINGQDGLDGQEGYTFEYILNFTAPDYAALLELPPEFIMLDSDVMVVYLLWEVLEDDTEVWRALPQTLYFSDGILAYNYDWTKYDANIFLDGTVNLDGLGSDLTDNWIARIVVLPAQFSNTRTTLDYMDYDQVKEHFNLPETIHSTDGYPKRPEINDKRNLSE